MQTYNQVETAPEANHELKPIADLLEKDIAAPSLEPAKEGQDSVPDTQVAETTEPETPAAETVDSSGVGKTDCLADTAEIVKQVYEYHVKSEKADTEALLSNWEAGTRIDTLKESVGHGMWESFLKENFPDISLTTIWRYRQIAKSFTLEDLKHMTLSQAYAKLKLAKFEDGTSTEDGAGEEGASSGKKTLSREAKLISTVAKAAKKFDAPTSLSQGEKSAVKKLCVKLEDVYGQVTEPSILGLDWQVKIVMDVSDWTPDEVAIYKQDFAKLQKVQKDLELLEGEPDDFPQEVATPLADAPMPVVPEPESVS